MLSIQSPLRANVAKAANAQTAARAPPKRSEISTPATVTPTQVIQREEVGEPGDEVVEEVREAVEGADDDARALGVALVDEPRLEVVQVRRQRVPDEPRRPRVLRLPAEVGEEHDAEDRAPSA